MLLQVIVGALLGLVLFGAVVVLVLRRAPLLFVADKLPGTLYGDADQGSGVVDDGVEREGGGDAGGTRRSADEADVIDRPDATDGDGSDSP